MGSYKRGTGLCCCRSSSWCCAYCSWGAFERFSRCVRNSSCLSSRCRTISSRGRNRLSCRLQQEIHRRLQAKERRIPHPGQTGMLQLLLLRLLLRLLLPLLPLQPLCVRAAAGRCKDNHAAATKRSQTGSAHADIPVARDLRAAVQIGMQS